MALRPGRPREPDHARELRGRARGARDARGGNGAEARGVRRGDRRGGERGAHRRRPSRALAAARAVHGRGHRHEDRGRGVTLAELQAIERERLVPNYARAPVEFVRGERSRLWDADGNEYLDFLCGISVTSLGHCHPRVVEAVRAQVGELMHVSNLFYSAPAMRLAELLSQTGLGGKVYLCNSGTEANEAAIKLARKARPGGDIVVLEGAFHGRTYGALSATPQESKQAPFAPLVPGFRAVQATPEAIEAAVDDRTAAVLIEPIQGETGVHVVADAVLAAARASCDAHGAALIFDEIQSGMGRTGTPWAYEQSEGRLGAALAETGD